MRWVSGIQLNEDVGLAVPSGEVSVLKQSGNSPLKEEAALDGFYPHCQHPPLRSKEGFAVPLCLIQGTMPLSWV